MTKLSLVGESLPYKGLFRKKKVGYQHLLSCLFTSHSSGPKHGQKRTIHGDCSKKELLKFIPDCKMWLEKSLTEEDKKDNRIIWSSIKIFIDPAWDEILSKHVKIDEKDFDEISKLMELIFLEQNGGLDPKPMILSLSGSFPTKSINCLHRPFIV